MTPTKKLPLFCVTGASCVGKSTACAVLHQKEKDYIVLESDILWNDIYNTPEDDYKTYRAVWMELCANISQIGLPCVVCGCCTPKQFEYLPQRELFTEIHYLAVVCDDAEMERRMTQGQHVTDEDWIRSSLHFNAWLKENVAATQPNITLVDATGLTPEETAEQIDHWIRSNM